VSGFLLYNIDLKLQRKAEQLDTESMPEDITIMELSSELCFTTNILLKHVT